MGYSCTLPPDALLHPFPCSTPESLLSSVQAFSVLPLSGELQPGERQQVSFTFLGHPNTMARVTALCHVQGGPTYQVKLIGEASRVSYSLSAREIDCGLQVPHVSPGTAPCPAATASRLLPTPLQGSLPFTDPLLVLGLAVQPLRDISSIQAGSKWPSPTLTKVLGMPLVQGT